MLLFCVQILFVLVLLVLHLHIIVVVPVLTHQPISPISTAKRAFRLAISFKGELGLKMLIHRCGTAATDIMLTVRGNVAIVYAVLTTETAVFLLSILYKADRTFTVAFHLVGVMTAGEKKRSIFN